MSRPLETEVFSQKEKKNAHQKAMRRYLDKRKDQRKRVDLWIEHPQNLDLLKSYARLNQTEVINLLVDLVAEGMNEEDYPENMELEQKHERRDHDLDLMVTRLLECFEKDI